MKIIFLDIDGVITIRKTGWMKFNKSCISELNRIIEHVDAYIVISSSWRIYGIKKLTSLFEDAGVESKRFIGVTPRIPYLLGEDREERGLSYGRGYEISQWLESNKKDVDCYVVIDDDKHDLKPHHNRQIQTSSDNGLTKEKADEAIKMLMRP